MDDITESIDRKLETINQIEILSNKLNLKPLTDSF